MDFQRKLEEIRAKQAQMQKQQGLGRPIISELFQGYRFVAVGSRLFYSRNWKTFHDFLLDYIKDILTPEWGNEELRKSFDERHPILQWYELTVKYMNSFITKRGEVHRADMTGAVAGYLGLAYNLYLLSHNERVQESLVARLRRKDQFQGAHYEAIVAATFIKAGFSIEFENEGDPTQSHCEFTATHRGTGENFSVEAKSRAPGKENLDVGNQLYMALRKEAKFQRVVFIDINVPNQFTESEGIGFFQGAIEGLRSREGKLTIESKPAPPAYIFLTNFAYGFHLQDVSLRRPVLAEGFKISDFKIDSRFRSLREALKAEENHKEMFDLLDSFRTHDKIPATFDGEIPEFGFNEVASRLKIGNTYEIPTKNEKTTGILVEAIVVESERCAYCVYQTERGENIIGSCPLTNQELQAYRDHPDTFFGANRRPSKKIDNPVALFHEFFGIYKDSPKEKLLEFMSASPDFDLLKNLAQDELAFMYCERLVYSILSSNVSE